MAEFLSISGLIEEPKLLFGDTITIDSTQKCILFTTASQKKPYFKSSFTNAHTLGELITSDKLDYHKLIISEPQITPHCQQLDRIFVSMISKIPMSSNKPITFKPLVRNNSLHLKIITNIKSSNFSTDFITEVFDKKGNKCALDMTNSNIAFIVELIGCMFNEKSNKIIVSIIMRVDQVCIDNQKIIIPSNKLTGFQFNEEIDIDLLLRDADQLDDIVEPDVTILPETKKYEVKQKTVLPQKKIIKYPIYNHNNSALDDDSDNDIPTESVIKTYTSKKRIK